VSNAAKPLVLVTVGTDFHPFTRLIQWVDRWLELGGEGRADCVIQHGTAPKPERGRSFAFLEHAEFTRLAGSAAVVVCHGGPATIAECRRLGHVPVVVPRRPDLGEHVDNHQVLFSGRLANRGLVQLAAEEAQFVAVLDEGVANPTLYEVAIDDEPPSAAAARRFGELVAQLPHRSGRR
jgi:UDP-N-acetylglucosamine transferase subunit ALG13